MKTVLLWTVLLLAGTGLAVASHPPKQGLASWYGEGHRGKLMANGRKFDPDKLTAASWFYPLGTKVRVTVKATSGRRRSVLVTITDRGPAAEHVRAGRIIDLGRAAFEKVAPPDLGLVAVTVQRLR
ncbi:MAG: septal ring lytic transglycosylase RlpA family protein [Verrucomicrobiota bacterium]|jgi:rare lipoprotein A